MEQLSVGTLLSVTSCLLEMWPEPSSLGWSTEDPESSSTSAASSAMVDLSSLCTLPARPSFYSSAEIFKWNINNQENICNYHIRNINLLISWLKLRYFSLLLPMIVNVCVRCDSDVCSPILCGQQDEQDQTVHPDSAKSRQLCSQCPQSGKIHHFSLE